MPDRTHREYSDEEASRIWRRAAELQARRRLPASAESRGSDSAAEPGRLSGDDVVAIAREAGIDEESIQQAIAEDEFAPLSMEDDPDAMLTRRRIDAPVATVEAALQVVAAREPFSLRLVDIRPAGEARLLVFDLGDGWGGALRAGSLAIGAHFLTLQALVQPGDAPESSEVILYGPPNPNLPRLYRMHDVGFGAVGGLFGGGLGAAAGLELALAGAVIAAPLAAGALILGGASIGMMRTFQRWSRGKDETSLERFADEIVGAVRISRHGRAVPAGETPSLLE